MVTYLMAATTAVVVVVVIVVAVSQLVRRIRRAGPFGIARLVRANAGTTEYTGVDTQSLDDESLRSSSRAALVWQQIARPFGCLERWYISFRPEQRIVLSASLLEGQPLSRVHVHAAAAHLARKHAALLRVVDDRYTNDGREFARFGELPPPSYDVPAAGVWRQLVQEVEVEHRDGVSEWSTVASMQVQSSFDEVRGPLWRIVLGTIVPESSASSPRVPIPPRHSGSFGQQFLLVCFHHLIADGNSTVIMTKELLNLVHEIASSNVLAPPKALDSIPEDAGLVLDRVVDVRPTLAHVCRVLWAEYGPRALQLPAPRETFVPPHPTVQAPFTNPISLATIDRDVMPRLRECCRVSRATVHGALCAAAHFTWALLEMYYEARSNASINSIASPICLRRHADKKALPPNAIGVYISQATMTNKVTLDTPFWPLAVSSTQTVAQDAQCAPETIGLLSYCPDVPGLLKQQAARGPLDCSMCISNVGNHEIQLDPSLANRFVKAIFIAQQNHVGRCAAVCITLITVNGEMHLTFATPGRRVPLEFQHRFARVFPQVLATAAEPEQAKTLLAQVSAIDADILCLQECDFYDEFWQPELQTRGYLSFYSRKPNGKRDGCATFWKADRFHLIASQTIQYNDLAEGVEGISREELLRDNIGQLVSLELRNSSHQPSDRAAMHYVHRFVVFNTHLFWNYRYQYTRFRQTLYALEQIEAFERLTSDLATHESPAATTEEADEALAVSAVASHVVMCGDYNSCPDTLTYRLLTSRRERHELDTSLLLPPSDHYDHFSHWVVPPTDEQRASHAAQNADTPTQQISEQENRERLELVASIMPRWHEVPLLQSCYERANYQALAPTDPADCCTASLKSASLWSREPLFTNYRCGWCGVLDYIFLPCLQRSDEQHELADADAASEIECRQRARWRPRASATASTAPSVTSVLELRQVLRLPDVKELRPFLTLPSDQHGSDHVPVACKFELRAVPSVDH